MTPELDSQINMMFSSHIILFLFFMGVAAIINRIKNRMVVNGALLYLLVGGILFVVVLARMLFSSAMDSGLKAEVAGSIVGVMLLPFGVSSYFAIRFHKKKAAKINAPAS